MKIEHKIISDMIMITVELPLAVYTDDEKIKVSTERVKQIANEISGGRVLSTIRDCQPIKNFVKNDCDTNRGAWIFELKPSEEKPAKTRTKRQPTAKKTANQVKSSGKSTSIRGRMSKIAKDINESN